MTTTDLSKQTPAEIDGQLYPILEALAKAEHYRDLYAEATAKAEQGSGYDQKYTAPRHREKRDEYAAEAAKLDAQALPEAEWEARQWTRYLVVPGGHLHRRNCHTLTPGRTMVGQVAEASGLTEDEVVAKYDETACTHCFADAPVAKQLTPEEEGYCPLSGVSLYDERLAKQHKALVDRYGEGGWRSFAMARSIHCTCGGYPALTKSDKVRKHKPGTPQL